MCRRSLVTMLLLLLGAVALFALPSPVRAQGGPCAMLDPTDRTYAVWSGPWANHGSTLDIQPQGCGVLTWRDGRLIGFTLDTRDGVAASGRIVIASPQLGIRGDSNGILLTLADDGTLAVEWDGEPRIFCRTWAWVSARCGA